MKTIHNIINLRGMKEQAFKFAFGYKGGMRQCVTRGCEIFVPLHHALKSCDLSEAIRRDRMYSAIVERPR